MPTEPLDLSGADTSAFEPFPSGRYIVHVNEAEWEHASGIGKLPEGTPVLVIQFEVDSNVAGDTAHAGRKVYNRYSVPPADYEKADIMRGMFARFIHAATGAEMADITSGKFKLDKDDLIGQQLVASVKIQPQTDEYDAQNRVQGVRPLSEAGQADGGLL